MPSEQVSEFSSLLAQRLGIPVSEARNLVRGGLSHADALALCKPLTQQSLRWDLEMSELAFLSAFVGTGTTEIVRCFLGRETPEIGKAVKASIISGVYAGATYVIAAQIGRSSVERSVGQLTVKLANKLDNNTHRLIGLAAAKNGSAAQTAKILNSHIVANIAATTVQSVPDFYRLATGQIGIGHVLSRLKDRTVNIAIQQVGGQLGATVGFMAGAAITGGAGAKIGGVAGRLAGEVLFPKIVTLLNDLAFGMPEELENAAREMIAGVALEVATERRLGEWAFENYLGLAEAVPDLIEIYRPDDAEFCRGLFRWHCELMATLYTNLDGARR